MLPDGTPLFECPAKTVTRQTATVCGLFPSWEAGRAVSALCAVDEPASLVAAFRVIGAELSTRQREEMDRGR